MKLGMLEQSIAIVDAAFEGHSIVSFYSNRATEGHGGAIISSDNSNLIFTGNSTITFNNNKMTRMNNGKCGAVLISHNSSATFTGHSKVMFINNDAVGRGILTGRKHSNITFKGFSTVTFNYNKAKFGVIDILNNTNLSFKGNSSITFNNNSARAMYFNTSNGIFEGNSIVKFYNNKVPRDHGGAVYFNNSNVAFKENSFMIFHNNSALNGGAMYSINSTVGFQENTVVNFSNNNAIGGGAIFITNSILNISGNSTTEFINNSALLDGGAVYVDDQCNVTCTNALLKYNTAGDYGGAVYCEIPQSKLAINTNGIRFYQNSVGIDGNSVYLQIPKSCNHSCFVDNVKDINIGSIKSDWVYRYISTPPNRLKLNHPAKCIQNSSDTTMGCSTYFIQNIMLGQEIIINACLLDYFSQPTKVELFQISSKNDSNYKMSGSNLAFIECNRTVQGINIIGNKDIASPFNYSMIFTLHANHKFEWKTISLNLTIELLSCHPGFFYQNETQRCECYKINNIVSCSGSNSTIKRGYWFGKVNGKPTVTHCPINYCNFTCCEATDGVYHLSPIRANQCTSHRSGTACGTCEKDYTLSFDSPLCVKVNKCTSGQTALVVTLTVLYWVVAVTAVFVMMYYRVPIGYLYAVTYYYSIVDLLLNQILYQSNQLYTTVTIMSSMAKLTPQFLGQLCFIKGMSGIDQQFIHYIHPLAISSVLMLIIMLARFSYRISSFISKGILHFICFLLLLSYTSVATTSLLLMRSLSFVDVDRLYTYLSPDIEYFHGRHLVYGIVAILCTIVIVLGLPLLLLLEPFLNHKINFIRIKPLLDQFQGCYKDKYRCFAAYYMICRVVIIMIIIVASSDSFTVQYLLITASVVIALLHLVVRPYADNILNIFDGFILQLMILVIALPILFNDSVTDPMIGVVLTLIIIPLIMFFAMELMIHKENICKNIMTYCRLMSSRYKRSSEPIELENLDSCVDTIIDESDRINATICDM